MITAGCMMIKVCFIGSPGSADPWLGTTAAYMHVHVVTHTLTHIHTLRRHNDVLV